MSAKAVTEATAKNLLSKHLKTPQLKNRFKFVSVKGTSDWAEIIQSNVWLSTEVSEFQPDLYKLPIYSYLLSTVYLIRSVVLVADFENALVCGNLISVWR